MIGDRSFFSELKRRKVHRTGAAYVVASLAVWGAAEVATQAFGWSDDVLRVVIIATIVGLPVALYAAWVYDVRLDPGPAAVPLREYLRRIIGLYEEQPISRSFVSLSAEDAEGNPVPDALEDLKGSIREDPTCFALVLGDYGSGKTSLMFKLAYDLAREALDGSGETPAPLFLSLAFARDRASIVDAFSAFVSRYGIDMPPESLRDLLNAKPNLVFILDGFDEMANRTEWSEVPSILEKLREISVSRGVRLVLTSRTTFFRDRLDEQVVPATKRLYLSQMGDEQVEAYISKKSPEKVDQVMSALAGDPRMRALCRSPIHLVLFVAHLAEHDRPDEELQPIEIYSSFVDRNLLTNATTNMEWSLLERRSTVRRLAYQWFRDATFEVGVADVRQELEKEIPGLEAPEYRSLAMQLLNCSFFMRVADRYRFFHFSFLEYFAAETLVEDLYRGALESWNERPLYAELFDFMAQMIQAKGIQGVPRDAIVDGDLEIVQSNFLATMYRRPIAEVWDLFDRLLLGSSHPLVRCVAAQGIGLSATQESIASLQAALDKEQNSVLRAIFATLIQGLRDTADQGGAPPPPEPDPVAALTPEDAIAVLRTDRDSHALEAYRKALLIGDRRWTSTVAAIYLLAAHEDVESARTMKRIGSESGLAAIRRAYHDVLPLIATP